MGHVDIVVGQYMNAQQKQKGNVGNDFSIIDK